MAIKILAATTVSTAKPKEKAYTLSDGEGLQLLIKPNGSKLWEFYYQSPTLFKRRKTSFGLYEKEKNTLLMARAKANKFRKLVQMGIDPIDKAKKEKLETKLKKESAFEKVVAKWFETQELKESTYKRKLALFEREVIPAFEKREIKTIKHSELVKILESLTQRTPERALRLFSYLDNLWRYATSKGYCDFNIVTNIHKESILRKVEKKHFSKITDLPILKELINSIYHDKKMHYSTKNALKFVLHVPLRATNLINLKWDYIDFDKKLLTFPRELMKNKDKNLPDFTMPLSDEVINILKEQHTYTKHQDFVFIGSENKPINVETPNRALQRLDFNNEKENRKQRLHSFRGTFRSLCETYEHKHHISDKIQEIALDHHTKSSVVIAYNNKAIYTQQLKPLMEWWSSFIVGMVDEVQNDNNI